MSPAVIDGGESWGPGVRLDIHLGGCGLKSYGFRPVEAMKHLYEASPAGSAGLCAHFSQIASVCSFVDKKIVSSILQLVQ